MALESIRYNDGKLEVLDQLLLPAQNKYIAVKGVEDGWKVINRMQVRGAPAIAIVGCLSLTVEIIRDDFADKKTLRQDIEGKLNYLVSARPTAVNVSNLLIILLSFFRVVSAQLTLGETFSVSENSTNYHFGVFRRIDENCRRRAHQISERAYDQRCDRCG